MNILAADYATPVSGNFVASSFELGCELNGWLQRSKMLDYIPSGGRKLVHMSDLLKLRERIGLEKSLIGFTFIPIPDLVFG